MEQRNAVPQGTARPRPPRTAEERQRDRRLALSLLTRLAAAAAALTVLLGVVLLVTQAEGQDMFPAVKDGDLLIAYRLQRRWAQDDLVLYRQEGVLRLGRVAAVGGGMVGDLAGFAAATYMRGVDFYNVPTTLLAQVDSSVGGKTAIDMDGVKNIVGAFHQPRAVLIDTDTLRSLPPRQMAAGLAESVKMAVTCDAALLALIENSADLTADLPEIIARSLAIKARVVEQDPTEQGLRRVLNFGHTIGHAIESCAGGELLHGECVALGMLPMCAPALRHRLAGILRKCSLPTTCGFTARQLLPYLRHDKKAASGEICIVLADEAGAFRMEKETPEEILRRWEGAET